MDEDIKNTVDSCIREFLFETAEDVISNIASCIHDNHIVKDLFIKHTNIEPGSDVFLISGQGFSVECLVTNGGLSWPKKK
jgi:hypothetical protein